MKGLTDRQLEILEFVSRSIRENGYPPTIREVGKAFGIRSTNGVRYYLSMLERAGHLKRSGRISRGMGTVGMRRPQAGIPILGRVAAGVPALAEESIEGHLEPEGLFGDPAGLFALRVRGDSMIGAHICDGDLVLVRRQDSAQPNDIVVALIDAEGGEGEATVKRFLRDGPRVVLKPENPALAPIVIDTREQTVRIVGRVVGLVRGIA